jgi:hypothetical protein
MSANVNPCAQPAGAWLRAGMGAMTKNAMTRAVIAAPGAMNELIRKTRGFMLFI